MPADMPPATGPLAGIRVIDVTSVVLGPYATQMLGDLGADVIKVESPRGDDTRWIGPSRTPGMGSYFANLNRNKRSIVLDLKQPPAKAALLRLIDTSDVFVHNMRPAAANRLGLDYASLSARNPRLIHASASGFRPGSTRTDAPAFDDLIQGMSGLASLNAGPDGAPRYAPTVLVDKLTGHMLASMIGMALFHRERSGQGQEVHVPMLETTLGFLLVEHLYWGTLSEPERGLGYPRMLTPHRRPYPTKDGFISVIASSDAQYARLLTALGRPELIDDPRFASMAGRALNIDAVLSVLTEGLRTRTTAEWLTILTEADIPCGNAARLGDLFSDDYLRDTGFFQPMRHPTEGAVTVPAIAPAFSASPPTVRRLWPALGEHTCEILREAGLTDAEIEAIAGPTPSL
ncbi:MAG TPA: CoA transferase [Acetobacteraceae bacterium]|jgi:crotonobetainyl-CoA:carnitine CoA-transferase CaiB-like acyl-CoA transferase|nr:CoA transferase [Acetobacteraceae bacterium]